SWLMRPTQFTMAIVRAMVVMPSRPCVASCSRLFVAALVDIAKTRMQTATRCIGILCLHSAGNGAPKPAIRSLLARDLCGGGDASPRPSDHLDVRFAVSGGAGERTRHIAPHRPRDRGTPAVAARGLARSSRADAGASRDP